MKFGYAQNNCLDFLFNCWIFQLCKISMFWCVCNDIFLSIDSLFEDTTITYVRCICFDNFECLQNWEIHTFYRLNFEFNVFDNLGMNIRPRRKIFFSTYHVTVWQYCLNMIQILQLNLDNQRAFVNGFYLIDLSNLNLQKFVIPEN